MTLKEKNLEKYGSWFSCLLIRKMSRELIEGLGGASINFMKCFPLIIKKKRKKEKKKKETKNAESMDCKFEGVVSQKLERT